MSRAGTEIVWGVVCLVIGLVLWTTTEDVETPVIRLTSVGAVLMVVGGAGLVYGVWTVARRRR